jgi:cystathionine beta-lyase/cystathionine gamma-synthase
MSNTVFTDLSWILNHLGEDRGQYFGAVTPPIAQTSNFAFPTVGRMRELLRDEYANHFYSRGNNPTVEILRKKLAALEGTEDALVFASGAGAMAAAVLTFVRQGDEVISSARPYSWTRILLRDWLPRFGVAVRFIEGGQPQDFAAALSGRTRLVVLESPNSMTFEQQDVPAIAALARAEGALTLVDNSYASPLLQQPASLGADLVMHSATKYLNGHSDVVAGVLCGSEALLRQVFQGPYMTFGAIAAPFDAWLLLRGLRTLEVRMERIVRSTAVVLDWLRAQPGVERLYVPPPVRLDGGLRSHSGMFSVVLRTDDQRAVERFCDALQRFLMAVSWGGHESLIFPFACLLDPDGPVRTLGGLPFNLVRFSIGLEDPQVLIDDLQRGFAAMDAP